jgi:putative ATP-dependent endonuclease of OLD family
VGKTLATESSLLGRGSAIKIPAGTPATVSAMMRLVRVEVENFRSIEYVSLNPGPLCALVGPNNAGKSNILTALELILGRSYPVEGALNEHHFFYRDPTQRIRIKAIFHRAETGGVAEHSLEFRYDEDHGRYILFYMHPGIHSPKWANGPEREQFPIVRVGVDRETRRNQPTNRWTLLGRLLLDINREFHAIEGKCDEFEQSMEHVLEDVLGAVPGFQMLRETVREECARQLGRRVTEVSAHLQLHDPWDFYRTLQLVVSEYGISLPANQMGMGVQSSLVIALLRAYAKIARDNQAVIAIEEPELFLHPLAKPQFYRLMREMSQLSDEVPGIQIIYTTHSSAMVSLAHFDEVCIIRRQLATDETRWTTTCRQLQADMLVARLREAGAVGATEESTKQRLHRHTTAGRDTALFADLVVLVEGDSEVAALPIWASACGLALDEENIAVVSAGGKTALPSLRMILEMLGVPCYVIADGDSHNTSKARPEINRELLRAAGLPDEDFPATTIRDHLTIWSTCYERELSGATAAYAAAESEARQELATDSKAILARVVAERLIETETVPDPIHRLVVRIRDLRSVGGQSTSHETPPLDNELDAPPWGTPDDDVPF